MKKAPSILGLTAAAALALTSCTGGGDSNGSESAEPAESTSATAESSESAQDGEARAYSEDELRDLISGMTDAEGNELTLYSEDQVEQGSNLADLLLSTATVNPEECKSIATAGLLDSVDNGNIAVALSESEEPRTLSAQSGEEGPSATELLEETSGTMEQCKEFTIEAAGQQLEVTSEELDAETDAEETFATVSTRGNDDSQMLMQVSAAEGRLLVVATKGGADLGDEDQQELEDLVNEVLGKTEGGSSETPSESETTEPTDGATEEATDGASETATDEPTEEMSEEPTDGASEEMSEEPTDGASSGS